MVSTKVYVCITCKVAVEHRTGVEMEALTGASVAALTIYDMCKALSHDIVIEQVRLLAKRGGKRDNMVEAGKWVLIGLREWDISPTAMASKSDKIQQCDLLEVFNDADKSRLKDTVEEDWHLLDGNDPTKHRSDVPIDASDIVFTTSKDLERQQLMAEMDSSIVEKIVFKIGEEEGDEEDVDVGDI